MKKEVKSGQGPPGARVPARVPGTGGGCSRMSEPPPLPGAGAVAQGPGPGGGGVLHWRRLSPLSRIWGQHPSVQGARPALRRLFAPRSSSSPPCDGNSPRRPRSGEGWRRFLERWCCPFMARAAWGGGRSPARDSALNGWFGGLARVCPTPDSGIPLGTELLLLEGSSHTSLPLTTRPPPYPETEGKAG